MQGIVTLTPPIIPDVVKPAFEHCNDASVVVLELLHALFAFGLFVDLLPSLTVPSDDNLQALEKMGLVHTDNFQFIFDLHRRRPP